MGSSLDRLVQLGGPALGPPGPQLSDRLLALAGTEGAALLALLQQRNGFYAFESALHVLPHSEDRGLESWNAPALWRDAYADLADGYLFFAEDLFGGQFCLRGEEVGTFDPETGEFEAMANDLEGWAREILADYEVLTGHPLAQAWQRQHGPLPAGQRLLPKMPFVAGGEYELSNLYPLDAVEGMRFRAELARQIRDAPDGAQIRIAVVD